jgi:hypothetical protein
VRSTNRVGKAWNVAMMRGGRGGSTSRRGNSCCEVRKKRGRLRTA